LQANVDSSRQAIMSQNWDFRIIGQELDVNELRDIHHLSVLPIDTDNDNIADNMTLQNILDGTVTYTSTGIFDLPFSMLVDDFDEGIVTVVGVTTEATYTRSSEFNLRNSSGVVGSGEAATQIEILSFLGSPLDTSVQLNMFDYVYFYRESSSDDWETQTLSTTIIESWYTESASTSPPSYPDNWENTNAQYRRLHGRNDGLNFAWLHYADSYHLIDPAQTNIVDIFIIPRGYYLNIQDWLSGSLTSEPTAPTPLDLRISYGYLLDSKMISDTVILHPGKFKLLFGSKAIEELQATFKVIRSTGNLTDNQVKTRVVDVISEFFDINLWEFGESFYVTELLSAIHNDLRSEIDSVVIVPTYAQHQFGDLFQILIREDEIPQADIDVEDIEIVQNYSATILRQDI